MTKNNGPLSICYPLKDSNFGSDISSERSKQMICKELKKKEYLYGGRKASISVLIWTGTAAWTYHFFWTVYTRNSELVLCGWRHRVGHCGLLLLLCGLRPVFGCRSRSGQRHRRTGRGPRCHHCGWGCRLSCSRWDGCCGGTGRAVAGWSFALSLNTASDSRLGNVGVAVSTEAARAAATVLRSLRVGTCPRSQLHQELLSICWTRLWCLHGPTGSTGSGDDEVWLGGKLAFLWKIAARLIFNVLFISQRQKKDVNFGSC